MTGTLVWVSMLLSIACFNQISGQQIIYRTEALDSTNETSYMLVAPKVVRPGHVYKVVVTITKFHSSSIFVRASISQDGVQIASDNEEITEAGISVSLMMKIPTNTQDGNYKLRVDGGILENKASLFFKESPLEFSSRSLTILIQTNKNTYTFRDLVKARIIMLTTEQKPFQDPVDIFILNPQGYIARRWVSHQSSLGVVSISFKVPDHPASGWWKIKVLAQGQVVEETIWIKRYNKPDIFVHVDAPAYVLDSQKYIEGKVFVNRTKALTPVYGNIYFSAIIKPHKRYRAQVFKETEKILIEPFYGVYNFKLPMDELKDLVYPLLGAEIEVRVKATDYFSNSTHNGYVRIKIINETVSFRFLGTSPQIFKPGMPFVTNLAISYSDNVAIDPEVLQDSSLIIRPIYETKSGSVGGQLEEIETKFSESGVYNLRIKVPKTATSITFKAFYDDRFRSVSTELVAVAALVSDNNYLHVTTSTKHAVVGGFIVLHLRTTFPLERFNYVVMSKGIIQSAFTESVTAYKEVIHTFAVPVSPSMSPSTTVVVYATYKNSVLSDSVSVPVDGISRNELYFNFNPEKDKTGKTVELNMVNYPGSMVFVSSIDSEYYESQSKNQVGLHNVLSEMYKFERDKSKFQRITWRSRSKMQMTQEYFVTPSFGYDTMDIFETVGLILYTNMNVTVREDPCEYLNKDDEEKSTTAFPWNYSKDKYPQTKYAKCVTSSKCIPITARCNGVVDCPDRSDEANCAKSKEDIDMETVMFFMMRKNMQPLWYDATGKDFAWQDTTLAPNHDGQTAVQLPVRPTDWVFSVYCMHNELGFGVIDHSFLYDARLPFYMTIETPKSAVVHEQIGVRVAVFNLLSHEIEVLMELKKSKKFKSVMVEGLGDVNHYSPRTTHDNIQHLIFVRPHSHKLVHFPVVAQQEGKIKVKIIGRTQIGMSKVSASIKIVAEGALQHYHTSLLLNLRNVPIQLSYLNINITETPVIPYEIFQRYVWGSPHGVISVSGDVVGPAFPKFPVQVHDLKLTTVVAGEFKAFDFSYHLLTLRYLWITNQWDPTLAKKVFSYLQVSYSDLISKLKNDYFYNLKANRPSTWLTAIVTRSLQFAMIPEWENFLYVDPKIISDSVRFLVNQQNKDGSFYDHEKYPFDRKMSPMLMNRTTRNVFGYVTGSKEVAENITLTAQVALTLIQVSGISGELRVKASSAKTRALKYLENRLPVIKDPYILSLVTYVLTLSNNVASDKAFRMLDAMKIEQDGYVYWSREKVPADETFIQNQIPYIVPRKKNKHDAINVESTAYALLTYLRKDGFINDKIVEWLVKVKYSDAGFCSTRDTLVAMEALIEYSYRSRVRDVTNLQVKIEVSSLPGIDTLFKINQNNLAEQQKLVMPDVHGNLEAMASGGGLALMQLDVSFGVNIKKMMIPPPVKAFDLVINTNFSGRNNSQFHVNACVRWNMRDESERSGFAMLEIQLPSGYYLWHNLMSIQMRKFPNVAQGFIRDRVAKITFPSVGRKYECVDFTINRWYPVANLTRFMLARVYEFYSPEYFTEEIVDVYAAHVLSICEVCGSFQCPYCPYFSGAIISSNFSFFLLISGVILAFYMSVYHHKI